MGRVADDCLGEKEADLQHNLPSGCIDMCRLVVVCADRQNCGGAAKRATRVVILDEAHRRRHRFFGRSRLHVLPMQDLCKFDPPLESLQQV